MWHYIVRYIDTNISWVYAASFFRVEKLGKQVPMKCSHLCSKLNITTSKKTGFMTEVDNNQRPNADGQPDR